MAFLQYDHSSDATGFFICCGFPLIMIIVMFLSSRNASQKRAAEQDKWKVNRKRKLDEVKAIDHVYVGQYLVGLPKVNQSGLVCYCVVTEEDYVFISHDGVELDRISRGSVNLMFVDDKSQITQRITVTRLLALGIFSLAAPKKEKTQEFCILIDWEDPQGMKQNSIFEFSGANGSTLANQAVNKLKGYLKAHEEKLKPSEKKCPYCAEIIKSEAKLCRFCGSKLEEIQT